MAILKAVGLLPLCHTPPTMPPKMPRPRLEIDRPHPIGELGKPGVTVKDGTIEWCREYAKITGEVK